RGFRVKKHEMNERPARASSRRAFLETAIGWGIITPISLSGCALIGNRAGAGKVVVVGAGYGGATAAKYLAFWSGGTVEVTLIETNAAFISCPLSNLVLGGSRDLADLTIGYDGLAQRGVRVVRDTAIAVDPETRLVRLESGTRV